MIFFSFTTSLSSILHGVLSDLCIFLGTLETVLIPSFLLHSLQVPAASPALLGAELDFGSMSLH